MKIYFQLTSVLLWSTLIWVEPQGVMAQNSSSLEESVKQSVVLISREKVIGPTELTPVGSGVIIAWKQEPKNSSNYAYYVLTANHVVEGSGNTYEVKTNDEQTYLVDDSAITRIEGGNCVDLAVLKFSSNKQYRALGLEEKFEKLSKNTNIHLVGWAEGSALQFVSGEIKDLEFGRFLPGRINCKELGVPTLAVDFRKYATGLAPNQGVPGMSGGPVVNQNGNLVGIYVGTDLFQTGWATSIKTFQAKAPLSVVKLVNPDSLIPPKKSVVASPVTPTSCPEQSCPKLSESKGNWLLVAIATLASLFLGFLVGKSTNKQVRLERSDPGDWS